MKVVPERPLKGRAGKPAPTKHQHNRRLWLSLHEDAGKVEWPPTIEGQVWHVLLSASSTLHGCNHAGLFRASPVFPATDDFRTPDLPTGKYYLCFFCFD